MLLLEDFTPTASPDNNPTQELLVSAKKAAMDLMFLADKADQEASKEAGKLQDMQRAPFHSEDGTFDRRVDQRRVWMAKNEAALQVGDARRFERGCSAGGRCLCCRVHDSLSLQ